MQKGKFCAIWYLITLLSSTKNRGHTKYCIRLSAAIGLSLLTDSCQVRQSVVTDSPIDVKVQR